jgi:hypothetical protein
MGLRRSPFADRAHTRGWTRLSAFPRFLGSSGDVGGNLWENNNIVEIVPRPTRHGT